VCACLSVSVCGPSLSHPTAAAPMSANKWQGLRWALVDSDHPSFRQVVLDTTNARELAEFYRKLLGYSYRPGDEPPAAGHADVHGSDWLVLPATFDEDGCDADCEQGGTGVRPTIETTEVLVVLPDSQNDQGAALLEGRRAALSASGPRAEVTESSPQEAARGCRGLDLSIGGLIRRLGVVPSRTAGPVAPRPWAEGLHGTGKSPPRRWLRRLLEREYAGRRLVGGPSRRATPESSRTRE